MSELYVLKHKNTECGVLSIDRTDGKMEGYKSFGVKEAPFLGNDQSDLMKKWWAARCVPATRKAMQEVIRLAGCETSGEYLAKNLSLSMTDSYWICPIEADLKWEDVNLRKTGITMGGRIPYRNTTSYDPNASLTGQMEKYWDLSYKPPQLIKTAGMHYGQQALNEQFAANLHKAQGGVFPYVEYSVQETADGDRKVVCPAFTSETIEFVPAMEVLDSEKVPNDESMYDAYIRICSDHGLDREYISDYLDYQTLSDFVIMNTDEHMMNFGVLRNADAPGLTGTAPIFDSGNSMYYSDTRRRPYERYELLELKITSFHSTEEAMLKHVKNRRILKADLLPTPAEVFAFYAGYNIPEEKAQYISNNYEEKVRMLREFQNGKMISLYTERKKHRMS